MARVGWGNWRLESHLSGLRLTCIPLAIWLSNWPHEDDLSASAETGVSSLRLSFFLFSPISLLFFLSCPSRSQPSLSKFLVTIKKKSRQWGVERSHRPDTVQPCPCWPLLLLASAPRHPGCPSLEPDTLNCQGHGGPRIFSPWIQMTGWLGSVSRFWLRCGDGLRRVDLPS